MSLVGKTAPQFEATAVYKNAFQKVKLEDYREKWVLLFFYPLDFTFVCPTEITAISDLAGEFEKRGTQILGVSVDSEYSHNAWMNIPRNEGGIGQLNYPLLSDITKSISTDYGVLLPEGAALRATYIIDNNGIVQFELVHSNNVGRNVKELIRNIDALQYASKHGEVCPAGWQPGDATIIPDVEKSKNYFCSYKGK
jgi:peroxiredoxin (alkyl hydroperoxide reductase subunit C)